MEHLAVSTVVPVYVIREPGHATAHETAYSVRVEAGGRTAACLKQHMLTYDSVATFTGHNFAVQDEVIKHANVRSASSWR